MANLQRATLIENLCQSYGTTPKRANLLVCQGRKKVYVLRIGEIHSTRCFIRESPSITFRDTASTQQKTGDFTVLPNGWKVASVIEKNIWIAEVSFNGNECPQFQFSRLDEHGNIIAVSGWQATPSGACREVSKGNVRHNGKLFLGCHYDYPQQFLRKHFSLRVQEFQNKPEIKSLLEKWLLFVSPPLPEMFEKKKRARDEETASSGLSETEVEVEHKKLQTLNASTLEKEEEKDVNIVERNHTIQTVMSPPIFVTPIPLATFPIMSPCPVYSFDATKNSEVISICWNIIEAFRYSIVGRCLDFHAIKSIVEKVCFSLQSRVHNCEGFLQILELIETYASFLYSQHIYQTKPNELIMNIPQSIVLFVLEKYRLLNEHAIPSMPLPHFLQFITGLPHSSFLKSNAPSHYPSVFKIHRSQ